MHAYDDRDFCQGEAMNAVWVVDDDRSIRWVLEKALAREGIAHKSFASVYEVTQALQHGEPQVIVTDIRMPGESGLVLLGKLKESHPTVRVIIMTAYSDLDSAVAAFQGGAFEYLPKPFDIDHALALIRRASAEVPAPSPVAASAMATPEMLGQAPAMQEVFRAIGRLSQSHVTVLITGESCTGTACVRRSRLWPSTPRRYRRTSWNRSCSAMNAARSPARRAHAADGSSRPTAARFSSMKLETCRPICRYGFCVCWLTANTIASAATRRCAPTFASSLRRIRIWKNAFSRACSAKICCIG